jgi:mono/diheme cytochrome c family protein
LRPEKEKNWTFDIPGWRNIACFWVLGAALIGYTSRVALAQDGSQMASGELEFRQYCAPCHGLEGTGDGPVARALKKRPADLTSLAKNNSGVFPAKEVHDFIYGTRTVASHGPREMPIWGYAFMFRQGALAGPFVVESTPQEAEDKIARLVDYVKSIQRK